MAEHKCNKEADIATLLARSEQAPKDTKEIKAMLKDIFTAIEGNGKPGLKERITRVEQKQTDSPTARSLILYSTIGGGGMLLIGIIVKFAFGG